MIDPTEEDVGRKVVYTKGPTIQIGFIKSFTEDWVFVRYHSGDTAAATSRKDLDWFEETLNLSWLDVESYCYELANTVRKHNWEFDGIYAVTRGGLFPALMLSHLLHIKRVDTICISSYQGTERKEISTIKWPHVALKERPLIVDDIADSGETMRYLSNCSDFMSAKKVALTVKPDGAGTVDAYARMIPQETWVNFPWE